MFKHALHWPSAVFLTLVATVITPAGAAPGVTPTTITLGQSAALTGPSTNLIGTTLAGYTGEREKTEGPDLDLLAAIAMAGLGIPLIAEGRIHTPAQARAALDMGAFAVVVGTAITHPASITGWFDAAMRG